MSVRLKLTLSYAGFLMVAGALLLAVVWVFLLRYIPDGVIYGVWFPPNRSDPLNGFTYPAASVLAFLLVFGLLGGWILAGRMLAHRIRLGEQQRQHPLANQQAVTLTPRDTAVDAVAEHH